MIFNIGGGKGKPFNIPTYTGDFTVYGDKKRGYMEIRSSGTLTMTGSGVVDVFLLGGGMPGKTNENAGWNAAGGAGSAGQSVFGVKIDAGTYAIKVGGSGEATTAFGFSRAAGGGAAGGASATHQSDAGNGNPGTSYPFGETSGAFVEVYGLKRFGAGGGGGGTSQWIGYTGTSGLTYSEYSYSYGYGGTIGGGNGGFAYGGDGVNGAANTGSGGGGGGYRQTGNYDEGENRVFYDDPIVGDAGKGGSGIVIIRWGDWTSAAA